MYHPSTQCSFVRNVRPSVHFGRRTVCIPRFYSTTRTLHGNIRTCLSKLPQSRLVQLVFFFSNILPTNILCYKNKSQVYNSNNLFKDLKADTIVISLL